MTETAKLSGDAILSVDSGGTFTDFVVISDGRVQTLKRPSTPDDPSRVIIETARELFGANALQQVQLLHGTTVATNTLLERRGARVALLTTRGFGDTLWIGRQDRPRIYDWSWRPPEPLVERDLVFEVDERIGPNGVVIQPLDEAMVEARLAEAEQAGAEIVVAGFLFSPENPTHEQRVESISRQLPVVISSEVVPEPREFERFSTATVAAYVSPKLTKYLARLRTEFTDKLSLMESSGGLSARDPVGPRAVRTIVSGPAGGVIAARDLAQRHGISGVAFDMGGTSTDVTLIDRGEIPLTRSFRIADLPVADPMIDVHTIGAGGGSLAWVDPAGMLRVGPQSAGAEPGPICYGRGGTQVTVTDAHVYLGRLPVGSELGGSLTLRADELESAFDALGREVGLGAAAAAYGVIQVAEAEMARAIRKVTQERGVDPRGLTLITFGGAGALHAAALAQELRLASVLIPPRPGVLSALGMVSARPTRTLSAAVLEVFLPNVAVRLEEEIRAAEERVAEEYDREFESFRTVLLRYVGQAHALEIPFEISSVIGHFRAEYIRRFGRALDDVIEVVSWRSRLEFPSVSEEIGSQADLVWEEADPTPSRSARETTVRQPDGSGEPVSILDRAALNASQSGEGPVIIAEETSTTWVPQGFSFRVLEDGTLELRADANS